MQYWFYGDWFALTHRSHWIEYNFHWNVIFSYFFIHRIVLFFQFHFVDWAQSLGYTERKKFSRLISYLHRMKEKFVFSFDADWFCWLWNVFFLFTGYEIFQLLMQFPFDLVNLLVSFKELHQKYPNNQWAHSI